nr:hypothetical protein [Kibdelosporangium sp. MJ126-NF4]CEL16305.1 hypothetical protein [Kibdelosporangium sp. MJ126-NF4]CTQ94229.1 hypothetical protein [Kibdelosporangium sp. MJ126-NF4]
MGADSTSYEADVVKSGATGFPEAVAHLRDVTNALELAHNAKKDSAGNDDTGQAFKAKYDDAAAVTLKQVKTTARNISTVGNSAVNAVNTMSAVDRDSATNTSQINS